MKALQRRSQKTRMTWPRFSRLGRRLAAQSPEHASVPRPTLCRYSPKVGAQCGSSARWGLCGGRGAILVPTAIATARTHAGRGSAVDSWLRWEATMAGRNWQILAVALSVSLTCLLACGTAAPPSPSPTSTAPTIRPSQVQGSVLPSIAVIEAVVRASPITYTGPCPATITFSARISVASAGIVSYRFIRSDAALAPVATLIFRAPGSMTVITTWQLGGPGLPTYTGWEAVRVLNPPGFESPHATFTMTCG
jgi:hypothetical protein